MATTAWKPLFFHNCGAFEVCEQKQKYSFFFKNNGFYAEVAISQNFLT